MNSCINTEERIKIKRKAARYDTLTDICESAVVVVLVLFLCGWI